MIQEQDEIVAEVRRIREAIAKENNYDLRAISASMAKVPLPAGSALVSLPPKRIRQVRKSAGR